MGTCIYCGLEAIFNYICSACEELLAKSGETRD